MNMPCKKYLNYCREPRQYYSEEHYEQVDKKDDCDITTEIQRKYYIGAVEEYCAEVLSPLSTTLSTSEQERVIDYVKELFLNNAHNKENFDVDHLKSTAYFLDAVDISNSLIEISFTKSLNDAELLKYRAINHRQFDADHHENFLDTFDFFGDDDHAETMAAATNEPEYVYSDDSDTALDDLRADFSSYHAYQAKRPHRSPDKSLDFRQWLPKNMKRADADIVAHFVSEMKKKISLLIDRKMNIAPFTHSIDIVGVIRDYFSEIDSHTVYTRYIYKDQIYAFEFERFLSLFQDYISRVKNAKITYEEMKTEIGIVYVIKSTDNNITKFNINEYVQEFAEFLDYCDFDTNYAETMLVAYNLSVAQRNSLIHRFQKEARRLKIDIKHETETSDLRRFKIMI